MENKNAVERKIIKNQSLDTNIESSKQSVVNPGTNLSIPEQNVRRHSIGTSAVASASIVQRLQQIAAESDKKPAGGLDCNKPFQAVPPGPRFGASQPYRNILPNAIRGRAPPIMGPGVRPGGRPMGPNKRTSNPDLTTAYQGKKEDSASLRPLESQMAARRFSSDMRIADLSHLREGNMKGQIPFDTAVAGNTQPYTLHLDEANSFHAGIFFEFVKT